MVLDVILKIDWILLSETHRQQERQWLSSSDVSGDLDTGKQALAHRLCTQNIPLGLCCCCFSPKDSIKADIMDLRWQCSNLRAIQKHKWCVYSITCYKLGSWSTFKKENLTWDVCVGGRKGLSRMPWNKQKIIQHSSALFIKAMVFGFEILF